MAEKTINCRLITPEAQVLDAAVSYASVPLHDGQYGVMHRTGALVGKLGFGELQLHFPQGDIRRWFIDAGFVQNVEDRLTILASGAIPADAIDPVEARAELAEAVARRSDDPIEMQRITDDRTRARAKLAVARAN